MTKWTRREESGERVWDELAAAAGPLTFLDLMAATGLTRSQVRKGLEYINHHYQETMGQPLAVVRVYSGGKGRPQDAYSLPDVWSDQMPWSLNRLRDLLTRARTESTRARASEAKWPSDVSPFLGHSLDRLVTDIEYVLTLL